MKRLFGETKELGHVFGSLLDVAFWDDWNSVTSSTRANLNLQSD